MIVDCVGSGLVDMMVFGSWNKIDTNDNADNEN
jgi:hypothetical protein